MKSSKYFVKGNSKSFETYKYDLDYVHDKKLIDHLIKKSIELQNKLNPVLARDSSRNRTRIIRRTNAFAGLLSEFLWRNYITLIAKKNNLNINISYGDFSSKDFDQTDLEIVSNSKKIKIEVRSSFPYKGVDMAILKNFDVIGWYENSVKIKEIRKDFYLRALFPYKVENFTALIKKSFSVYLAGGASEYLLQNSDNSKYKKFIPYYERKPLNKPTRYRVIEPIYNGFDTYQVTKDILDTFV